MPFAIRSSGVSVLVGSIAAVGLIVGGCYGGWIGEPGGEGDQNALGVGGQGGSGGRGAGISVVAGGGDQVVEPIAVKGKYPTGTQPPPYKKGDGLLRIDGNTLITGQFPEDSDLVPFQLYVITGSVVHIETFDEAGGCEDGHDTALALRSESEQKVLLSDNGGRPCAAITSFLSSGLYDLSVFNTGESSAHKYVLEVVFLAPHQYDKGTYAQPFTERYTLISDNISDSDPAHTFKASDASAINVTVLGDKPHTCRRFNGTLFLNKKSDPNNTYTLAVIPGGCIQSADIEGVTDITLSTKAGSFAYNLLVTVRGDSWLNTWESDYASQP